MKKKFFAFAIICSSPLAMANDARPNQGFVVGGGLGKTSIELGETSEDYDMTTLAIHGGYAFQITPKFTITPIAHITSTIQPDKIKDADYPIFNTDVDFSALDIGGRFEYEDSGFYVYGEPFIRSATLGFESNNYDVGVDFKGVGIGLAGGVGFKTGGFKGGATFRTANPDLEYSGISIGSKAVTFAVEAEYRF